MYPKNALAQKANGPGLPPPLTKKTFYRKRLSHTLFSNQKHRNFSKLEFFLLKGHEIFSKSCKVCYPQNALGVRNFWRLRRGRGPPKNSSVWDDWNSGVKRRIKFPMRFLTRISETKKFYVGNTKSIKNCWVKPTAGPRELSHAG